MFLRNDVGDFASFACDNHGNKVVVLRLAQKVVQ